MAVLTNDDTTQFPILWTTDSLTDRLTSLCLASCGLRSDRCWVLPQAPEFLESPEHEGGGIQTSIVLQDGYNNEYNL